MHAKVRGLKERLQLQLEIVAGIFLDLLRVQRSSWTLRLTAKLFGEAPRRTLIRSKKARVVRTMPVESWRYGYDASPEGRKLQL